MRLIDRGIVMPRCFNSEGQYFMVVIDSRHRKVREFAFDDLSDAPRVEAMLKAWLDTVDPLPVSRVA